MIHIRVSGLDRFGEFVTFKSLCQMSKMDKKYSKIKIHIWQECRYGPSEVFPYQMQTVYFF